MINVDLIDHMGSDLSVVNAARVSFDKESKGVYDPFHTISDDGKWATGKVVPTEVDAKLIAYLARENHWSPFAHCYASFRISAPIFVARQLQKHTVGLAWNEVSRRYVDAEPTFYTPETWRKRAENVKQGSSDEAVTATITINEYEIGYGFVPWKYSISEAVLKHVDSALELYESMLKAGVCPEQARMVLPQSMMTEWIWSGSLYAFARVCNLRLDSHAQRETQIVAKGISDHMSKLFPVSWSVLVDTKEH